MERETKRERSKNTLERETKRELITPERARELLDHMVENRKVRWDYVHKLAGEIIDGTYVDGTDCVGINTDGLTCDGQHRLLAIIEADKPIWIDVKYGVPTNAVIDRGNMRSVPDSLVMRGMISKELGSNKAIATANAYLQAKYGESASKRMTEAFKGKFMNDNAEPIILACNLSGRGGQIGRKAGVQAALFAALLAGVKEDVLNDFMKTVNTGFQETKEDTAAIVLRNYMQANPMAGSSSIQKLLKVTEAAIYDFVHRVPRTKVYNPANLQHKYISRIGLDEKD